MSEDRRGASAPEQQPDEDQVADRAARNGQADASGHSAPRVDWPDPSPRRLDRPPSERYEEHGDLRASAGADEAMPSGPAWAVGIGIFAALIPAAILVVLAWLFGFTAGLVVVAIFLGRIVGLSVRGARNSGLASDARTLVAIVITLVSLAATQVAIWLLALREGGVLPFADYLAQTYGPVVPLEAMLGTIAAWLSAR